MALLMSPLMFWLTSTPCEQSMGLLIDASVHMLLVPMKHHSRHDVDDCSCYLMHVALTVQGAIYPKLAGHIAHFLAQTLFKTSLIALSTAEYR